MPNYDETQKVVTIFDRKKMRPMLDEKARASSGNVPSQVYFVLPDGSELPVDTTTDMVIGRQPRQDDPPVTVDLEGFDGHDLGVSRHHAMMKVIKDNLVLVDLDSINGTFVNGHRAMPLKRYNIVDGDTITIGRLTVELRFRPRTIRR